MEFLKDVIPMVKRSPRKNQSNIGSDRFTFFPNVLDLRPHRKNGSTRTAFRSAIGSGCSQSGAAAVIQHQDTSNSNDQKPDRALRTPGSEGLVAPQFPPASVPPQNTTQTIQCQPPPPQQYPPPAQYQPPLRLVPACEPHSFPPPQADQVTEQLNVGEAQPSPDHLGDELAIRELSHTVPSQRQSTSTTSPPLQTNTSPGSCDPKNTLPSSASTNTPQVVEKAPSDQSLHQPQMMTSEIHQQSNEGQVCACGMRLEQLEQTVRDLQSLLTDQEARHQNDILRIKTQIDNTVQAERSRIDERMESLKQLVESEVTMLETKLNLDVAEVQQRVVTELQKHRSEAAQIQNQTNSEVNQLKSQFQADVTQLRSQMGNQRHQLLSAVKQTQMQRQYCNKNHEDTLKRLDMQDRMQNCMLNAAIRQTRSDFADVWNHVWDQTRQSPPCNQVNHPQNADHVELANPSSSASQSSDDP